MIVNEDRVPITIGPIVSCPLDNLPEAIDGFATIGEVLQMMPLEDQEAARDFLDRQIQSGFILWRDEWSPLRWCRTCNLPLLQEHCDRCHSEATGKIELKFPCNPRPVLPHDEFIFRGSGLPWPVDHSVVVNAYHRPDYSGWEVIRDGFVTGELQLYVGTNRMQFKPSPRYYEDILKAGQTTMSEVLEANQGHLDEIENEAVEFIRARSRKNFLTIPIMTFSGGKDSAVLADLCHRSGVRMRVIQIDTGIDPVDNARYSRDLISRYGNLKLVRLENGDMFWRTLEKLGPPASDFQWCRRILKLSAPYRSSTSRFIHILRRAKHFIQPNVLLIDGPRRREEEWRKILKRAVSIPESPVETTAVRPILDWTDLDIWMYLHRHQVAVNPTYCREKQQRLVCLFCPDKDRYELDLIKEHDPKKWDRFERELRRWQGILRFPDEWVNEHLWVRNEPTSAKMRQAGIEERTKLVARHLESEVKMGKPLGNNDSFTVAGKIIREFDLRALGRWFRPLGSVTLDHKGCVIRSEPAIVEFTRSGKLMVTGNEQKAVAELAALVRCWIVSFLNCIGCGACVRAGSFMVIAGERAKVRRKCRGSLEAFRKVVALCPVNPKGIRECLYLRQDS